MAKFKSSFPEHQVYEDSVQLLDGLNIVASGNGDTFQLPGDVRAVICHYTCTPDSVVGDSLDGYLQTRFNLSGVATWVDVIHFQQFLGNDVTADLYDKIVASLDQAFFEIGTALAVDTQRNLMGEAWRARWVAAGATPAFNLVMDIHPG